MCGGEVRDRSKQVSNIGIIGGSIALLCVALRLFSRLMKEEASFGLDDVTLCLLMVSHACQHRNLKLIL